MNSQCNKIKGLIEPFMNKDLGRKERFLVKKHLRVCAGCRTEFEKKQQIVDAFISLPRLKCPEKVKRAVYEFTSAQEKKVIFHRGKGIFTKSFGWRAAVAWGVSLVLVLVFVLHPFNGRREPVQIRYSEVDAVKVREQVKWSLVYVAQVIQKSERQVADDVLMDKLPQTVRNVIKNTVPIFEGGQL